MANNKIFKILKPIAVLSEKDNITKEFNLIQYKDLKNPILDLRKWDNTNNDKKMLKGITLTEEETKTLKNALNIYFNEI